MEYRSVRLHTIALLATWLAGTVVVLIAGTAAPIAVADLDLLRANAGWYAGGYGLFFVADGAIALLGVSVVAATAPEGRFLGPAIIVLFGLSGVLGMLADVRMVAAAQLLATGSPVLAPAGAAGFLGELNAACNWLSTASFLPAALATWLASRTTHAGPAWAVFTRFSALCQLAIGTLSTLAFFTSKALLTDLALAAAVVGMPVLAAVWLVWMLRDMRIRIPKEDIP